MHKELRVRQVRLALRVQLVLPALLDLLGQQEPQVRQASLALRGRPA